MSTMKELATVLAGLLFLVGLKAFLKGVLGF